jgi:hypothetical protein
MNLHGKCDLCDQAIIWEYGVWVHADSRSSLCDEQPFGVLSFAKPTQGEGNG